jgi:regulatory protein YycI of two-component signal transduction system YycFG
MVALALLWDETRALILEVEEDFTKKQKLFSSAKGCTKLYKNKELKNLSEYGK